MMTSNIKRPGIDVKTAIIAAIVCIAMTFIPAQKAEIAGISTQ